MEKNIHPPIPEDELKKAAPFPHMVWIIGETARHAHMIDSGASHIGFRCVVRRMIDL
jgi:hypothetical protein